MPRFGERRERCKRMERNKWQIVNRGSIETLIMAMRGRNKRGGVVVVGGRVRVEKKKERKKCTVLVVYRVSPIYTAV